MTQLSLNFTLEELTHSDTADELHIDNAPPPGSPERARLATLAEYLEKVRHICGDRAMNIHDAYRCPRVNTAVGGVANSAHPEGFAADFDVAGLTPYQTAALIDQAAQRGEIVFDQLILEQLPNPSWVHIGRRLHAESNPPRMQRLTKAADGSYVAGLVRP
jgi:zinc D-Ala-D-Ala carboxypeptidase